ncbi:MAG TPA: hypothetical protein VE075_07140 [Thermoanaerobaculia bacterium]|nr:hypothetical protein [Thermoanaerobaculia bacterium]
MVLVRNRGGAGLRLLLAGAAAWCGWFIFRSSFADSGKRVFCLLDDAMVAMTYARSLAAGHGLGWYGAGDPVEGFTQPLWMALMVPVDALPLALRLRSLPVQLLSMAALLWNLVLVRRLTLRHFSTDRAHHWLPAAVLTAFYYPLSYAALMGLESGLQALLTTALVLLALDVVCAGEDRHRELWLLCIAAFLVRMDMLPIVAVVQIYVLAKGGMRGPGRRASWFRGAALFGAVLAACGAWRWVRFHDLLPNAWYLRFYRIPPAVRLLRGCVTLWAWTSDHLLLLAAVAAGYVAAAWPRRRGASPALPAAPSAPAARGEPLAGLAAPGVQPAGPTECGQQPAGLAARMELPAALLLAACLTSVVAGGDALEADLQPRANRFLVFAVPLLFVLWNGLINQAAGWLAERRPRDEDLRRFVVTLATVLALAVADGLWLAADGAGNFMALLVGDLPAGVRSHAETYASLLRLQAALGPGRVVATGSPGMTAYFTGYRVVDLLGGNERRIARSAPAVPLRPGDFADYVPGRAKWDHRYVLARYRPDAVLGWRGAGDPSPWLTAAGYRRVGDGELWLRAAPAGAPGPELAAPAGPGTVPVP